MFRRDPGVPGCIRRRGETLVKAVHPAIQHVHLISLVAEDESRRRAAASGIAANNVLHVENQLGKLPAQVRKGDIDTVFECSGRVLSRRTHIDPDRTGIDHSGRSVITDVADQVFLQQLDEVFLGQAHQYTVRQHGHRGIAPGIRDQSIFTKAVTFRQLGQLQHVTVGVFPAGHRALALVDGIEIIPLVTLLDHRLAGAHGDGLHL